MNDDERKILESMRRSVSRRDFIAHSGAVALGAAGMGLIGVASPHASAASTPPKRGGRARLGMDSTRPDEFLDPMRSNTRGGHVRQFVLFNPLVRI